MIEQHFDLFDDQDPRAYRTELPNKIFDLELDPFEGWLYSHLKRIAGAAGGHCFMSIAVLAAKCKMSENTLRKAKKELAKKGLIRVEQGNYEAGKADKIYIVNIWRENYDQFVPPSKTIPPPFKNDTTPGSKTTGHEERTHEERTKEEETKEEQAHVEIAPQLDPLPSKSRTNHFGLKPETFLLVMEVFVHWKLVTGRSRSVLDKKRADKIAARLKEGYTVEELKSAIEGCKQSPYHNGSDPRNESGTIYDAIDLIFRSAEKTEFFMRIKTTQENLDVRRRSDAESVEAFFG